MGTHPIFESDFDCLTEKMGEKIDVAIIGAGIVGTTLSYELSKDKRLNITVYDRNDDVCTETSFANAGRLCPLIAKNSGPIGQSIKRAMTPAFLKDTFFPQKIDLAMPQRSFMKIDMSKNMVKFGFYAIYSQLFGNCSSRGEFMDWCRVSSQSFLQEILPERKNYPPNLMFLNFEDDRQNTKYRKWFYGDEILSLYPCLTDIVDRRKNDFHLSQIQDIHLDCRNFGLKLKERSLKNGVDFKFRNSVDKLVVSDKVCNGLSLENGSMVKADLFILCSALSTQKFSDLSSNLVMTAMRGASIDFYDCKNATGEIQNNIDDAQSDS